jgi:lipoprotein-releasing system ATP-binding protein
VETEVEITTQTCHVLKDTAKRLDLPSFMVSPCGRTSPRLMSVLCLDNVTKSYPTRAEPLVVLREVSLEIATGENLAVVGPSGSGKSTLLNILGTLDQPTTGRVLFDGQELSRLDERSLAAFRNRQIGFVFQDHCLLPQCSVLENVLLPGMASGSLEPATVDHARELLQRVGLVSRLEHRPAELSGGERQRAALARALVNRPTLLLADEPTGNLDRSNAERVADLLLELQRQEGMMLVVVTHSSRLAERMGRQVELDDGRAQNSESGS